MTEFAIPQIVRRKSTGEFLITQKRYGATEHYPAGYRCSPLNSHSTMGYPDDDLESAPPRKSGVFDYEIDIVPRASGLLDWEHVEPARLDHTLSNVAACAGWVAMPGIGWVTKPGSNRKSWARIFLHTAQNGGYTGQAHAIVYESGPYEYPKRLREAVIQAAVEATHKRNASRGNLAAAVLEMEATKCHEKECALPSAWLLSICKHEVIDSSTPSGRMRGWHPAHCSKCGINLSVDSSD
ncbi:hypothetical protein ACFSHT_22160 [Paraburkholderia silviterrae]|uniref:Uncharacterized protein n=1 Tax=Paraburkholderia silviterrae TaxID=2528715 RepID=A0A4R5MFU6_9BURK|nr:hypothetical protein [Paraburkholderia silviterrae]TDG25907.1 hypothetical protein EYW47_00620 [Paraburkholderia silviterrae]